ncbi:hypothetical protein RFL03_10190 [Streptococcus parasuis]|uniref:hypothetical protein n=1 Tax=Streptococcus parasuis TaxID=1501662 RepID=UPI002FC738A1
MSMFNQIVSNANKSSEETINVTVVNLGSVATPYKDYLRDNNGQKIKDGRGFDKKEETASKLKYQFSTVGQECRTVTLLTPIDKPLAFEPLVVYNITAYGYSFKNGGYWLTELVDIKPLLKLEEAPLTRNSGGKP